MADQWKNKFFTVLNKVNDCVSKREFLSNVRMVGRGHVQKVSPEEVCLLSGALDDTKCPTIDAVPNAVYNLLTRGNLNF